MSKFGGGKSVFAQYKNAPPAAPSEVAAVPSDEFSYEEGTGGGGGGAYAGALDRPSTPPASSSASSVPAAAVYSPPHGIEARGAQNGHAAAEQQDTNTAFPSSTVERESDRDRQTGALAREEAAPASASTADDWAIVSKLHEERTKQLQTDAKPQVAKPIRFEEAYCLLRADDAAWRPHLKSIKRISGHVKTSGFAGFWWSCLHTEIKESSQDYQDRDFVLALTFVTLDHSKELHRRMLISIFRKLVKVRLEDLDPPTIGPMWGELGFQGSDPGTDLRSTGMLGLLQILYLLEYLPVLAGTMFKVACNPMREFPFVLVAFNFSGVGMDVLKERGLHDAIHARRKEADALQGSSGAAATMADAQVDAATGAISGGCAFGSALWTPPPVIHAVCDLFAASAFEFFAEWVKVPARSITDFGPMKNRLREHIRENVVTVLKNLETARDRRAVLEMEQPSSGKGPKAGTKGNANAEKLEFHEF